MSLWVCSVTNSFRITCFILFYQFYHLVNLWLGWKFAHVCRINITMPSVARHGSVTKAFTFIVSIGASWWLRLGGKDVAKELDKRSDNCYILLHIATYCYVLLASYPRPLLVPHLYRFCDFVILFVFSFFSNWVLMWPPFSKLQKSLLQHIATMVDAAI